jgi:hypothetical protein
MHIHRTYRTRYLLTISKVLRTTHTSYTLAVTGVVVFLDSEASFQYVIGNTFDDFLRFLTLGYRAFDPQTISYSRDSVDFLHLASPDEAYSQWVVDTLGLELPRAGTDIVKLDDTELFTRIRDIDPYLRKITWAIVPYTSVGPLSWDMTRAQIASIFTEADTQPPSVAQRLADMKALTKDFPELQDATLNLEKSMPEYSFYAPLYSDVPYLTATFEHDGPEAKLVSVTLPRGADIRLESLDFSKPRLSLLEDLQTSDENLVKEHGVYSPKYGLSIDSEVHNYTVAFYPKDQMVPKST